MPIESSDHPAGKKSAILRPPRPSAAASIAIFFFAIGFMAYLRLYLFHDRFVALTYGLPLLVCLWYKDRRLLWSMAAAFSGMAALKAFRLLPDSHPHEIGRAHV